MSFDLLGLGGGEGVLVRGLAMDAFCNGLRERGGELCLGLAFGSPLRFRDSYNRSVARGSASDELVGRSVVDLLFLLGDVEPCCSRFTIELLRSMVCRGGLGSSGVLKIALFALRVGVAVGVPNWNETSEASLSASLSCVGSYDSLALPSSSYEFGTSSAKRNV